MKILISDVDGTLIHHDQNISDENPSLGVLTIFFSNPFLSNIILCRFYRLFLFFIFFYLFFYVIIYIVILVISIMEVIYGLFS